MSPNAGGGGGVRGLSQWVQLCTWSPNKLWRSNSMQYLTYGPDSAVSVTQRVMTRRCTLHQWTSMTIGIIDRNELTVSFSYISKQLLWTPVCNVEFKTQSCQLEFKRKAFFIFTKIVRFISFRCWNYTFFRENPAKVHVNFSNIQEVCCWCAG
jgi:hypothetical protein